ncbi:hypothetical protein B296_00028322 [Ensete ventricosum]|uniref:Uncharacterized protein n=1 Tax=Ensete ventricosum TaxID=4639 RepID=A0A426Z0E6_ENSVE|nr:hypothetical protein B296_00028322 [Ensete ventricosum]
MTIGLQHYSTTEIFRDHLSPPSRTSSALKISSTSSAVDDDFYTRSPASSLLQPLFSLPRALVRATAHRLLRQLLCLLSTPLTPTIVVATTALVGHNCYPLLRSIASCCQTTVSRRHQSWRLLVRRLSQFLYRCVLLHDAIFLVHHHCRIRTNKQRHLPYPISNKFLLAVKRR